MSDSGLKHLLADKFTISGAAAPRIGRNGACGGVVTTRSHCSAAMAGDRKLGATFQRPRLDAMKNAEILCWSRSRGMFEGVLPEAAYAALRIRKPTVNSTAAIRAIVRF